jgi:hypothetical protein
MSDTYVTVSEDIVQEVNVSEVPTKVEDGSTYTTSTLTSAIASLVVRIEALEP